MSSFASKLSRLPPIPGAFPAAAPASASAPAAAPASAAASASASAPYTASASASISAPDNAAAALRSRPTLDDLRDRIARIVGKVAAPTPRANPANTELPFFVELTDRGPLYVRRERTPPAARAGRAPLVAARDADAAMLSLLALDPALNGCDPRRALYIDTETTGLQGGTGTVAFLLGMSFFDESCGAFILEQALLRRLGEEGPILELLNRRLNDASMIVSFNGKSFDMPLLRARFVMNRLPPPKELPHLDLLHLARRIHGHRLKRCNLGSIESEVLGRERVGDVGGADVVSCYLHFLRTGDEGSLEGVVVHNEADVLSMVALVGLYGEPIHNLEGVDLAGVAKTLRRAGELEQAAEAADHAVERGGGTHAKKTRGDIAKARGDKARALLDYESIAEEVDDPSVRLELAKLYEHHVKSFTRALSLVEQGTGEMLEATKKRRARLQKKLERKT